MSRSSIVRLISKQVAVFAVIIFLSSFQTVFAQSLRLNIPGGCSDRKAGVNEDNSSAYLMDCTVQADISSQLANISSRPVSDIAVVYRHFGLTPNSQVPLGDVASAPISGCSVETRVPINTISGTNNWVLGAPNGLTSILPSGVGTDGTRTGNFTPVAQGTDAYRNSVTAQTSSNQTKWSDSIVNFNKNTNVLTLTSRGNGWGNCRTNSGDSCYACLSNIELVVEFADAQCQNGIDDDGDALIDLADPGCTDSSDDSEDSDFACNIQGILESGDTDTPLRNLRPFVNFDNSDGHTLNDPLTIPAGSRLQAIFNSLGYIRGNAAILASNNADLLARTTNSTVRSRYAQYGEVVELGHGSHSIGSPYGMVAEIAQPGILGSRLTEDSLRAESTGISGTRLSNEPSSNRALINAVVDGSPSARKMCEFFGFRQVLGANYRQAYSSPSDNRHVTYHPSSDSFSFQGASTSVSGYLTNTQLDHIVCADPILPARCMAACANGIDDDGDGLTDFPADPGCTSAADTSENEAGRNCDDGIDNDGDTFIDFPADPGCSSVNDGGETGGIACDNGNDDDGDGLRDFRPGRATTDPGCSGPADNTETNPSGPACDNGSDDDGDGLIDLAQDPGCASVSDPTETDGTCVATPSPTSFTDNFTTHPGSNPAWIQTANNIGSVSGGVFDMISGNGQTNSIEFQNFALDNNTWSIDFDFRFESIDDCADGFFTELSHRIGGVEVNHNTIEIDTYKNTGEPHDGDNHSGGQIGRGAALAILDRDGNHLTFSNEDLHCADFTSGVYKHLRIEFLNGNYKVFLDGSLRLDINIPSVYEETVVTFNARSGVDSHRTKIRNLQINSVQDPLCTTCDNGADDDGDSLIDFPNDPGCSGPTDTTETNLSGPACDNGVDDDVDGLIDSADPGCSSPTDPTETNPSGPACDNGLDDDGDGLIDLAQDPGCTSVTDTTETNPTGPACDNGVDDDGDTRIDFAQDPGCTSVTDTTETGDTACSNGSDDDGDSLTDFPADPGCSSLNDLSETNATGPACDNGVDDDGDTLVDSADPGCSGPTDTTETNPTGPACDNGVDDDGDTLVDSADPGCSGPTDTTETNPAGPACDNGVDDDGDTLVDSADPGCSGPTDTTETNTSGPACDNGVDDDGDGLIDLAQDPGCSSVTDPTETNPTGPACDNGVDDDGDTLVDSADPGCSGPTDTTETNPSGPACDNGVDDDGDTLVDSADPGCSGPTDTTETNPSGPACDNGVDDDGDTLVDSADPGCSGPTDPTETDGVACDNGTDDDGDTLVDSADPGCSGPTDTTETNPSGPACDNGIDDDGDTRIDFAQDPGCSSVTDTTETNSTGAACDNGVDDDNDGLRDFAQDPGCSSPTDTTETNPTGAACDNGVDDDNDGLRDFAQDPGCSSPTDTTETNPSGPACDNGVDDDGDTLVDSADPGCSGPTDTTETNPSGPACDNGVDDDGDALVDVAQDPGCSSRSDTTETNLFGPACDNGVDDDGDSLIDVAQDPGCSGPTDTTETNPSGPACDNGIDDDGDTRIDFAQDPGCSSATDLTETNLFGPACDNGIDDDGDALTDFAQDPGCFSPTDTTETNPAGPACDNGLDDDGDGLRDVAQDPGCASPTDTTETDPFGPACDNGIDDDGDLLRDFAQDPGCSSRADTTETNPTGPACDNGVDDDGDSLIDRAQDPGCSSVTDTTETNPAGPACDNGIDDDGDSLIDLAQDPGCTSVTDASEADPVQPACNNGIDDDGDSLVDFGIDPGCSSLNDVTETNPSGAACDNGIDDDGDSLIDVAQDPGCSSPTDTTETNPSGPACDNGIDDDGDSLVDSADPGCAGPTDATETNPSGPACDNGFDDDGDSLIDFAQDPGCSSRADTTETNPSGPACDNGLDDDGDSLIDLAQDPGCVSVTDTSEVNAGQPACNNAIDDDGDGLIDFGNDPGCVSLTDTTETNPAGPQCDNGIDDDSDGQTDFAQDTDCVSPTDTSEFPADNPVCNNQADDDGDNLIDFPSDPGCSSLTDATETNPSGPACDNGIDDDGDSLIDLAQDPGCVSVTDTSEVDVAAPGIPQNVQASDGADPDLVRITWNVVTGASSYQVFRSELLGQQGSVIGTTSTNSFDDTTAVPGVVYFYSVVARNTAGNSAPSVQDSGFVQDTGRLNSPVFTKFNTFLEQLNFLELISSGSSPIDVTVTIYSLRGQVIKTKVVRVGARSETDLAIHAEVVDGCNVTNPSACAGINPFATYGLVKLEFDDTDPNKALLGRMSNYRLDPDGDSYSFAFAKELRNPIQGRSYTATNTFDPQGRGFLVPNWAEIINLSSSNQTYLYRLYSQNGTRVFNRTITLRPLEERDIQAGHEIFNADGSVREAVYLAEVIPQSSSAEYLFSVTRYSSNAPAGVEPDTYNFAFALDSRTGAAESIYAPITNENRDADCAFVTNWLELANVQDVATGVTITFRAQNGSTLSSQRVMVQPKSQFHFNASSLFPTKGIGVAEITPDIPGAIISQSLAYFNDICGLNGVQTAYVSTAQPRGNRSQTGTINTFIGMENLFRSFATSSNPGTVVFDLTSFRGTSSSGVVNLSSFSSSEVNISANPLFNFPADTNGLIMSNTLLDGQAISQVLRVRREVGFDGRRRLDFVMPTMLR